MDVVDIARNYANVRETLGYFLNLNGEVNLLNIARKYHSAMVSIDNLKTLDLETQKKLEVGILEIKLIGFLEKNFVIQ